MQYHARSFPRLLSVLVVTFTLVCSFAAAQNTSPNGSYGFLVTPSFSDLSKATGAAFLGVMNFDGAGGVIGSYTYEVDANAANAPKTTTGTFTGAYSSNPDGTGSLTMALDNGFTFEFAAVIADGGQSLQLVATNFQLAPNCGCNLDGAVLAGVARAGPAGSLNGSYAIHLNYSTRGAWALGVASFDGAGSMALTSTFVGAGKPPAPPSVSSGTQTGTYSINPDGSGSFVFPATPGQGAQTFLFVITDNGSGLLVMQIDRLGSGVTFGSARLQ